MRLRAISLAPLGALLLGLGCDRGAIARGSWTDGGGDTGRGPGGSGGAGGSVFTGGIGGGGTGGAGGTGGSSTVALWPAADPCVKAAPALPDSSDTALYPPRIVAPQEQPGPMPLRRLTRLEYANTVRDLLGVTVDFADGFAPDEPTPAGFDVGATVTLPEGRQLLATAQAVAAAAVARLPQQLAACCTPAPADMATQEACAGHFIGKLGRRAFRRPLVLVEGQRLMRLYQQLREPAIGRDFTGALRGLIAAMLQAPQFLYRWELGPFDAIRDGQFVRLNNHEIASRLSYFFWASMPDEALFAAADAGKLSALDQIAQEASRLLASPKARAAIEDFHLQWLEVAELEDLGKPQPFSPSLARSMLAETREYVSQLFLDPKADGRLRTLLTSRAGFVDAALAPVYGVAAPAAPGLQPVMFDPQQRAGLLTQASVLARHARGTESDPTLRGQFLYRRLLCSEIPSPPPLPPAQPRPSAATTREWVTSYGEQVCASACHRIIDPAGFAFESYDGLGRHRTEEAGKPIDASGALDYLDSGNTVKFANAIELSQQLAKLQEVNGCMVDQWARYLLRRPDRDGETRLLRDLFRKNDDDLRALLVGMTRSKLFTHRALAAGEGSP